MATYTGSGTYSAGQVYFWFTAGLGTYNSGASSTSLLVFTLPDGTETRIAGTGLGVNLSTISWNTVSSISHTTSGGGSLIEQITNLDSFFTQTNSVGAGNLISQALRLADTIAGHSGVDYLAGGDGTDTFTSSGGADSLGGGSGLDTFVITAASHVVAGLTINGGNGGTPDGFTDVMQLNFSGAVDLSSITLFMLDTIQFMQGGLTVTVNANASATDWRSPSQGLQQGWIGSAGVDTLIFNNSQTGNTGSGAWSFTNWTDGVDIVVFNDTAGTNNSILAGTIVSDTINALGGGDYVEGLAGNDTLNGGDGDDNLVGGLGNDSLNGGNGNNDVANYAIIGGATQTTHAITVNIGAGGNGTVTGGASIGSDTLTGIETIYGTSLGDTFNTTDPGDNSFVGGGGIDTLNYTSVTVALTVVVNGNNFSVGNVGAGIPGVGYDNCPECEIFNAGTGNDTFTSINAFANTTVNGNGGTDTYSAGNIGPAVINLAANSQTSGTMTSSAFPGVTLTLNNFENATGGNSGDSITGNDQANVLRGLDGGDTLNGAGGDDSLRGGTGDDQITGGTNTAVGDTADYSDATGTGVTVSLAIAGAQAIGGGLGSDTLTGIENLLGSGLNDQLTGDGNANTVTGGGGIDTVSGGGGNDTLYGDAGNDNISGDGGADFMYGGIGDDRFVVDTYAGEAVIELAGEGTDVVYAMIDYTVGANIEQIILVEGSAAVNAGGGEDANVIIGNSANNVIYGYGGNDVISGGDGADSLLGMDGDDAIDGQGGNDQMIGGLGNDSFVIDSISDAAAEFAGEGIDTVYARINYTLGGNIEQLILVEGTAAVAGAGDGNDNVIIGNSAANTIYGNAGADTLYGFANADILVGGDGNDILEGGTGNDNLSGNAGADQFKFAAGEGLDLINDFSSAGGDRLVISSALAASFAAFQAAGSTIGGNAVYTFGGGAQTITLAGVAHTSLTAGDLIFF